MVKNITVRKLRSNLAGVLSDVETRMDRYVISKRGDPTAVLMCVDDYDGWLETLEIMSSKSAMSDIREARAELKKGKFYDFKDVFGREQSRPRNKAKE